MPVIKSAKKKLRQDKKRTASNKRLKNLFEKLVKQAKKSPTEKSVKRAISAIDKVASKNIIHENKAGRLKSTLSKLSTKPKLKSVTKPKKEIKKKLKKKSS